MPTNIKEVIKEEDWRVVYEEITNYVNPYPRSCYRELSLEKLAKYLSKINIPLLAHNKELIERIEKSDKGFGINGDGILKEDIISLIKREI